jgi:hypothetical protein
MLNSMKNVLCLGLGARKMSACFFCQAILPHLGRRVQPFGWNSEARPVKIRVCTGHSRKLQFHNPVEKRGQHQTAALGKCHCASFVTMHFTFSEKK